MIGESPLSLATSANYEEKVKLLITKSADINAKVIDGDLSLQQYIQNYFPKKF